MWHYRQSDDGILCDAKSGVRPSLFESWIMCVFVFQLDMHIHLYVGLMQKE